MEYIVTFSIVLLSSVLSGMSGGGGGFIMTPYFLLMGLSPQQNIAVGSVIGLGLSGGSLFAALLFVPMLFCMGLTAVEANIAKRYGALAQAIILFVILAPQELILWNIALASLAGAWIGGHAGTHIAIKNGERFAKIALAVTMTISGSLLLFK